MKEKIINMKFFSEDEKKEYFETGKGYIRCPRLWLAIMILEHIYLIYYFLNIIDNFEMFMLVSVIPTIAFVFCFLIKDL
jgi:hypothetical protein